MCAVNGCEAAPSGALAADCLKVAVGRLSRLMADLLAPAGPSTGETRLSQWLAENREQIGAHYASEVARHFRKPS